MTFRSKREQKRIEAAEHVCRAMRKAISCYATQEHYMRMALDWLIVWRDNAPCKVWQSDPTPRRKRSR